MQTTVLRFVLGALVAIALSVNGFAQTVAGVIKVARVQGEVTKLVAGAAVPLKNGDRITEADTVVTGPTGGVVLVFANGSSVKLGTSSKLNIEEFKMDPLADDIKAADIKDREPTVSKTNLMLVEGELIGEVKKLNRDAGSYYNIRTPVGAAGIRGTTFRIVFRPTGDGRAFTFQLSTTEGVVLFEGTTTAPGAGVSVPDGQEITVTAEVNPAGEIVSISTPTSTQTIAAADVAVIQTAVTEVIEQAKVETVITVQEQTTPPPPPAPTPPTPTPPSGSNLTETPPAKPTETPPPPPVVTPPSRTPGAGG